ncbi:MAG: hypothetical protein IPK46_22515 [Saprospiraceae bacterium]|nr:hypothetical protein [Saprospiraceae bacterium]
MNSQFAERRRAIQGGKFMILPNHLLSYPVEETIAGSMMHKIIIDGNSKAKILEEQKKCIIINDERVLVPIPTTTKILLNKIESDTRMELGIT